MSNPPTPETTLNIPSLLAFALLSFFAIRYFFFSPASPTNPSSTSTTNTNTTYPGRSPGPPPIPYDRIVTISAMFPQLSRRDIEWDLRRNGASVQATTERVLRTGRLDAAPAGFRAQVAPAGMEERVVGSAGSGGAGAGQGGEGGQKWEDLITRYGLGERVRMGGSGSGSGMAGAGAASLEEAEASAEVKQTGGSALQTSEMQRAKGGWSADKKERADLLRRRRQEMVLQARRKMEEKEREGKSS